VLHGLGFSGTHSFPGSDGDIIAVPSSRRCVARANSVCGVVSRPEVFFVLEDLLGAVRR